MKFSSLAIALLLAPCATLALSAQSPASATKSPLQSAAGPLIVDVHTAPYRPRIVYRTNITRQRFDMRNATIFDMIEFAYNLGEQDDDRENAAIIGGPSWVNFDHFDLSAVIPAVQTSTASPNPLQDPADRARPLVKRVLAERFHLKYHTEDRPLPGFVVSVAKDGPKLAEAKDPASAGECHGEWDKANPVQYKLTCTSETVAHFVSSLDQDFSHPIVDRTGLTKPYDFTLKLLLPAEIHTRDDRARVYTEAMNKQLGLSVARGDVPQPAIVIDTVDRTPTPNPPDVAKLLPAVQNLEFDVASIRPSADNDPQDQIRPGGSEITFTGFNLQGLITRAWQLSTGAMLGDALDKLPKTRYTIQVKLPPDIDGRALSQDQDQFDEMLQKLLIDRFEIRYHWGEWVQPDAFVLLGGTPKMKLADPKTRSFCKFGPAEGEKPNRYAGSPYDREFHCQNVTMAQFANRLQAVGSSVKNQVPDKTGLAGSYDFTVFFTSDGVLRAQNAAAVQEAKQSGDGTVAPVAGISLQDAIRKELGLRLEKQKLAVPSLVLDHFDQTPTEN